MPSLLITVFVLQLVIHLVNNINADTLNNLAWYLFNLLPVPTSSAALSQRKLQSEYLRQRRDLNNTSSQDEFAKWAKLRRQHDKTLAELEKLNASISSSRTTFDRTISIIRWLSTNGLRFVLQFWSAKTPVFWLPQGWVPWWIEWLLAFPKAPTGSVSVQVWFMACTTVIQLVSTGLVASWGLVVAGSDSRHGNEKDEVQKVGTIEKMPAPEEVKKEL